MGTTRFSSIRDALEAEHSKAQTLRIVAYIGNKPAQPLLVEGLKRLEYRGYASAGLAAIHGNGLQIAKAVGRVANPEAELANPAPWGKLFSVSTMQRGRFAATRSRKRSTRSAKASGAGEPSRFSTPTPPSVRFG